MPETNTAKSALNDAADHLDQALEHHAAGQHSSVKRRIDLARACIQRAIESSPGYQDPTAAMGAQVSNGQSPRSLDPEAIRQRDQLRGCELAYETRLSQMGVRR